MQSDPPARPVITGVVLGLSLIAALTGAFLTVTTEVSTSLWWNSAGSGVIVLLLSPRRWWPTLLAILLVGYLGTSFLEHRDVITAISVAVVGTTEIFYIGYWMQRVVAPEVKSLIDFARLLVIAGVGNGMATIGYGLISRYLLDADFLHVIGPTFTSHYIWTITLTTFVFSTPTPNPAGWVARIAQSAAVVGATVLVFSPDQALPVANLVIPIAILSALVFSLRMVLVQQILLATYITAVTTLLDWGPFSAQRHVHLSYALAQTFLAGMSAVTIAFAIALRVQRESTADAVEQRRRAEAVMESSRMAIVVIDGHGIIRNLNRATVNATGFSREDLIGTPVWQVMLPAARQVEARERFIRSQNLERQAETTIRTADGELRTIAYSVGLLAQGSDPASTRHVVTATDVTAERSRSQLLDHLLGSQTSVAIVATTPSGRVTLWNVGAQTILGLPAEEAFGRDLTAFFSTNDLVRRATEFGTEPSFEVLIAGLVEVDRTITADWTLHPVGHLAITASITTSVVRDDAANVLGYLFLIRDVTEVRHNQELLLEALEREQAAVEHLRALDRSKDDFVSTVSHELRTPLTSILGSVEMMTEGMAGPLSDQQGQLTEMIDRNCHRLLNLVDDLLLVATFENGTPPRRDDIIDLRSVIVTVRSAAADVATRKGVSLLLELPSSAVKIRGDHRFLERAVSNLVVNAIKFSDPGDDVDLRLTVLPEAGTAVLEVGDQGHGIDPDDVAHLFERFFRATTSHNQAIQGTGLGLPIVKSVVENHGGSIEVDTELGVGSTFRITLPTV